MDTTLMGRVMEMVERTGDKVVVFSQTGTAFVVTTFDDYEALTATPRKTVVRPAVVTSSAPVAPDPVPDIAPEEGADQYYMEPVE